MFDSILDWLTEMVFLLPALVICLVLHEVAHGWMAYALGDPTAKLSGRLSLNPFRHLDPLGTLMMLIFHFGYAKPVPVNPFNFKNKKIGMAVTAAAGPAANVVIAFVAYFLIGVMQVSPLGRIYLEMHYAEGFWPEVYITLYEVFLQLFSYITLLSAGLAVFNLIPLSPLDGSKMLYAILPDKWYFKILQYEQYGMIVLFGLMMIGSVIPQLDILSRLLVVMRNGLMDGIDGLVRLILRI